MDKEGKHFQIGDVAKAAEISIDTIRYYEKIGLLEKPVRSLGGFRLYPRGTRQAPLRQEGSVPGFDFPLHIRRGALLFCRQKTREKILRALQANPQISKPD